MGRIWNWEKINKGIHLNNGVASLLLLLFFSFLLLPSYKPSFFYCSSRSITVQYTDYSLKGHHQYWWHFSNRAPMLNYYLLLWWTFIMKFSHNCLLCFTWFKPSALHEITYLKKNISTMNEWYLLQKFNCNSKDFYNVTKDLYFKLMLFF